MDASEREALAQMLEPDLKPYRERFERHQRLPAEGRSRDDILDEMRQIRDIEDHRWADGFASGAVYQGDPEHIAFMNDVYTLNSQSNPLHADLWPSATRYEAEIVSMVAAMLHGGPEADDGAGGPSPATDACGAVSSGGTESILLAMKAYRDQASTARGIERPNMVVPVTAHAAFDKASQYFGIELRKIPVGEDMRAKTTEVRGAIDSNSVVVVGSAVQFPHGVIDPISELAEVAADHGIGFHTDSCLGGFILPWAEKLGYPVPLFDFRVPGVTSISCDTHKYGYAAKGTSVICYRDPELRAFQYYQTADWPGGLYNSPTFAGSRPGAHAAQAWASLLSYGEAGYLDATRRILETGTAIRDGIEAIPGLRILGDPLWVIAFSTEAGEDKVNIYAVLDDMSHRGWSLNGLQHPPGIHIAVTLRHTQPGVAERFLTDLNAAVDTVRAERHRGGLMAPIYGMAASVDQKGAVEEILRVYLDTQFRV
jgi:glutamate/tyrosine decarboxylase-like PLP-dependent enzyme